jgi:hypothetical protein
MAGSTETAAAKVEGKLAEPVAAMEGAAIFHLEAADPSDAEAPFSYRSLYLEETSAPTAAPNSELQSQ